MYSEDEARLRYLAIARSHTNEFASSCLFKDINYMSPKTTLIQD